MALHHNPRIVTSGLTFLMDPADTNSYPGTGTTVKNIAGTVIDGTLTGATFVDSYQGIFDLDGTDDIIGYGSSAASLVQGLPAVTMGLFFKLDATASLRGLIGTLNYGCTENLGLVASGTSLQFYNDTTTCYSVGQSIVSTGKWIYAVGTYDGNTTKIYGITEGTLSTSSGTSKTGNTNTFGSEFRVMAPYHSYRTNGQGSLAFVYNRALSEAEVLQNYNVHCTRLGLNHV